MDDTQAPARLLIAAFQRPAFVFSIFPGGSGPIPGRTAIPGRPVAGTGQAPIPWPRSKNQFNIQAAQ